MKPTPVYPLNKALWCSLACFPASQFATEVAHAEMYAASSLQQRSQPGNENPRLPRPTPLPGQHAPVGAVIRPTASCTIASKPVNIGFSSQTPRATPSRVAH